MGRFFFGGRLTRDRKDRRDAPTPIADVLRAVLERLPDATRLADHELWAHWDAVVGPTIAAHARPHRLQRGVLTISVDAPEWMQELQFQKQDLRDRLNARAGRTVVRDLYLLLAINR